MARKDAHVLAITKQAAERSMDGKTIVDMDGVLEFPFGVDDVLIGSRDLLENDPEHPHVIPYTLIMRDGKLLVYQRTTGGGESRLHGRTSVGFGGHIDVGDLSVSEGGERIDFAGTIGNAALREIKEELQSDIASFSLLALMFDRSDAVGAVHFGVVLLAEASGMVLLKESDKHELIGWRTPTEIINATDIFDNMESWSKLLVAWLYNFSKLTAVSAA